MTLLKRIFSSEFTKYLLILLAVHLLLFNINVAEWGDSYRIMRASEFLRDGAYPTDEKRPPLFALILATRPDFVDQTQWGRIVLLIFSIASFYLFWKLAQRYLKESNKRQFALILFIFNPVYLYWSLRVMADI